MKLAHTIAQARAETGKARAEGKSVGLVPTMGALHEGHLALVRRARVECDFVAVSIFVNPTQFGPCEDYDGYPRTLDSDAELCREAGVDLVFAPSASEMYPAGFSSWVEVEGPMTEVLEGASRPGHFRGVTTVCAKLFHIAQPDRAYFGLKDYQQLKIVQRMVLDLDMPLEIVPCDTVREPDGLAMSSRNAYLSADERQAATVLSKSLQSAAKAVELGERDATRIEVLVQELIGTQPLASIDYVGVVDADTLQPVSVVDKPTAVLVAARIGATRLIDNCVLRRQSRERQEGKPRNRQDVGIR